MSFDRLRLHLYMDVPMKYRATVGAVSKKTAKRIPIVLTGGVGDVIMARPLVEKIKKLCGPVEVYSKHPDVFEMLNGVDPSFHGNTFKPFDYWLTINSIVKFAFSTNFHGFKSDALTDLYLKHLVIAKDWQKEINYHPYLDNGMAVRARELGLNRRSLAWHLLGLEEEELPVIQLDKIKRRYITVHQGYETNQTNIRTRSTKNWSRSQWSVFVAAFKARHPDIMVIQLGAVTGHDIRGVDINYRNKLSMRESLQILGRSLCHVDGDSGLVHAAKVFGVRSVVLFGSTPAHFFGYKENINIQGSSCPEGGSCWWLKENWLKSCVLGKTTPICMDAIPAVTVLDAVDKILEPKEKVSVDRVTTSYYENVMGGPNE